MERYNQTFKCTCKRGDVVLRTSRKPYSYGKQYYACPYSKPGTQDRGCGFMWMDDLRLHISSSSGSSTPPSYSSRTSTRPSISPGSSKSAQNLGKAECSNCKFLAEKIKTLEAKIKILEGALEMEMHPEKHTLDSAAILHELYNEMGKLRLSPPNYVKNASTITRDLCVHACKSVQYSVDRKDDVPEFELPPRKRLCLSTLDSSYEIGESSTARPTRGRGDTWVDPAEVVPEVAPMTVEGVNTRVTELAELHERDTLDL
ncbi:hypothetical protein Tco_0133585 [Tanacetum coccineum]